MDTQNKYDQFFEQIKNMPLPLTATVIMNAIKANGYAPELKLFYLSFAKDKCIDIKAELDDLTMVQETAQQEKAMRETATSLAEKSGAVAVETDPEKRKELIEVMRRLTASLEPVKSKIFPTLSDIKARWDAYDPDKDFTPPMLGGMAIKNGSLVYLGARTGLGKTTGVINLSREGLKAERKVIFLTLEERTDDILRKLILCDLYANAGESRAILQKLAEEKGDLTAAFHAARKGKYVKGDTDAAMDFKQKVLDGQNKFDELYGNRLIFIEGYNLKTSEGQAAAIAKHAMPGDIVLVDYVQRIADPDGEHFSNYMKGKAQSETLFNIAKNTGAIVISGAQFKRAVSELPKELAPLGFKPFDVDSFREAGDIEQDGDYLFGIGDHMSDPNKRFIKILKVRSGGGRNRCYSIDFQGAFNYMGLGEQLNIMNPVNEPKPSIDKSSKTIRSPNPLK
jgi:replicative DNA helicase